MRGDKSWRQVRVTVNRRCRCCLLDKQLDHVQFAILSSQGCGHAKLRVVLTQDIVEKEWLCHGLSMHVGYTGSLLDIFTTHCVDDCHCHCRTSSSRGCNARMQRDSFVTAGFEGVSTRRLFFSVYLLLLLLGQSFGVIAA